MERSNILVTGANGFIGRFLSGYLQEAFRESGGTLIVSAYRSLSEKKNIRNQIVVGDVHGNTRWQEALKDVDIVVHLVARVHVMHEMNADPASAFNEVNTRGTINLAKQAVEAGVKRFVYLSTVKVNGEKTVGKPFYADDLPNPQDPYAISKFEAEQQLLDLSKKTGLEVVIIRPPLVYGLGVKGNLARLIGLIKNSLPLPFGNMKNFRSLVSLNNLCSLIKVCTIHPNAAGEVFLVSDGDDLSTSGLLKQIALALEKNVYLFYCPRLLLKILMYSMGFRAEFGRLFDSLQVNIDKNEKLLGWRPQMSVQIGISQIVKDIS